jgi:hypothetical protein
VCESGPIPQLHHRRYRYDATVNASKTSTLPTHQCLATRASRRVGLTLSPPTPSSIPNRDRLAFRRLISLLRGAAGAPRV